MSHFDESPEAALHGIRELVDDCVDDMRASGEPVPEPIADRKYTGKFQTRISPELHRALTLQAAEAGVSLNKLIGERLARTA